MTRRRTIKWLLFGIVLSAIVVVFRHTELPIIDWAARAHSQRGSVDCGRIRENLDAEKANNCAISESKLHHQFFITFTEPGIDEVMTNAIIARSDGTAIELFYATGMVARPNALFKRRCATPLKLERDAQSGRLHCIPWPPKDLERDFIVW